MGVDFYNCSKCNEIFSDCGSFVICEECECWFCSDECADIKIVNSGDNMFKNDNKQCCYCRSELVFDSELLCFLLKRNNLTREQLVEMWKKDQFNE